eukprot:SAG31_NODE_71_length_28115_cov_4.128105_6_plen_912_part_00
MELYSQAETELAAMVARNAQESATAVAADAEEFVSKIQASFLTATLRRHRRVTITTAFHGWSKVTHALAVQRRLIARNQLRADGRLLWRCISVWVTAAFFSRLVKNTDSADEDNSLESAASPPPPPPKTAAYGYHGLDRPPQASGCEDVMATVASMPSKLPGGTLNNSRDNSMHHLEPTHSAEESLGDGGEAMEDRKEGVTLEAERLAAAVRGDAEALAAAYQKAAANLEMTLDEFEQQLGLSSSDADGEESEATDELWETPEGFQEFDEDVNDLHEYYQQFGCGAVVREADQASPAPGWLAEMRKDVFGENASATAVTTAQGEIPVTPPQLQIEVDCDIEESDLQGSPTQWSQIFRTPPRPDAPLARLFDILAPATSMPQQTEIGGELLAGQSSANSDIQEEQAAEGPVGDDSRKTVGYETVDDLAAPEKSADLDADADAVEQEILGQLFDAMLSDAAAKQYEEGHPFSNPDAFAAALETAGGEAVLCAASAAAERQMTAAAWRHYHEGQLWRAMSGWIEVTKRQHQTHKNDIRMTDFDDLRTSEASETTNDSDSLPAHHHGDDFDSVAAAAAARLGDATAALDAVMLDVEQQLASLDPEGWAILQPQLATLEAQCRRRAAIMASQLPAQTEQTHMESGDATDTSSECTSESDFGAWSDGYNDDDEQDEAFEYPNGSHQYRLGDQTSDDDDGLPQDEEDGQQLDDYLLGIKASGQLLRRLHHEEAAPLTETQQRLMEERHVMTAKWRDWARRKAEEGESEDEAVQQVDQGSSVAEVYDQFYEYYSDTIASSSTSSIVVSDTDEDTDTDSESLSVRLGSIHECNAEMNDEERSNCCSDFAPFAPDKQSNSDEQLNAAMQLQRRVCWEILDLEQDLSPPVSPTSPMTPQSLISAPLRKDFRITPDHSLAKWC